MGDQEMQKNLGGENFNASENKQKPIKKMALFQNNSTEAVTKSSIIKSMGSIGVDNNLSFQAKDAKTEKYCKILENLPSSGRQNAPPFKEFLQLKIETIAVNDSHLTTTNKKYCEKKANQNWQNENLHRLRFRREIGQFPFFKGMQSPSTEIIERALHERLVRNALKEPTAIIFPEKDEKTLTNLRLFGVSEDGCDLVGSFLRIKPVVKRSEGCPAAVRAVHSAIRVFGIQDKKLCQFFRCPHCSNVNVFPPERDARSHGSYGLCIDPTADCHLKGRILVDVVVAQMDDDVTCLLYATQNVPKNAKHGEQQQLNKETQIKLSWTPFDLTPESEELKDLEVFNQEWNLNEQVYSLSFCAESSQFCAGTGQYALIYDISDVGSNYLPMKRVPTNGHSVLASAFQYPEGNTLFLGLQGANAMQVDLRLVDEDSFEPSQAIVGHFEHSQDVCQIRAMETRGTELLAQRYNGELALWDVRRRDAPVCIFESHVNWKPTKLPWFVDYEERFVFMTGSDSVVRGWSLAPTSGPLEVKKPLCEIPVPPPSAESPMSANPLTNQDQFPSVVYSDHWGSVYGNVAILIAANGKLHLHELREF